MEALGRLRRVPWLRRIVIAFCIVIPTLILLYFPPVAALTIWGFCILAASEHSKLRIAALERLAVCINREQQGTEGKHGADGHGNPNGMVALTAAYSSPLLLMVFCSLLFIAEACDSSETPGFYFLSAAACVSFGVAASAILIYARHPDIPESRDALLYAWASAGLDLCFLWHYAVPLALGSFILRRKGGLPLAACLIALSAAGDCGALFCGSAFGRRRIIERLSPNKTLAGVLGSVLWSLLAAALLWHLALTYSVLGLPVLPLVDYLAAGALTSFVGLFGDLVESGYKRCAGVKDSSTIFGPHGGMLDRLDSLVLPIPFLVFFLMSRGHL